MTRFKKVIRRVLKRFNKRVKTKLYSVSGLIILTILSTSIAAAEPAAVQMPEVSPQEIRIELAKGNPMPVSGYSEPVVTIKVVESEAEAAERQRREQSAREAQARNARVNSRSVISRSVENRVEGGGNAQEIARQKVIAIWGEDQWPAFQALIQRESGWVVGNRNRSSGACGLAQAYPCSKLGSAYGNVHGEVDWAINYVARRYGTPVAANNFQASRGWY